MILVKLRGKDGDTTRLKSVKSIKLSLRNEIIVANGPCSKGWGVLLKGSGDKNIEVKIQGILCDSKANKVLSDAALHNTPIFCEIALLKAVREIMNAEFFVELYEKDFEAGKLEFFSVTLVSNGKVEHINLAH